MENQVQKFLIKLRKIAQIPEGGRIDLTSGDLEIYQDDWFSWIWRNVKNDGRVKTMDALKGFYTDVIAMNNDLMTTECIDISNLQSVAKQLVSSIQGLKNIKDCPKYKGDQKVSSVIDFIVEDLLLPHIQKLNVYLKSKGVEPTSVIVLTMVKKPLPISPGTSPATDSKIPNDKKDDKN